MTKVKNGPPERLIEVYNLLKINYPEDGRLYTRSGFCELMGIYLNQLSLMTRSMRPVLPKYIAKLRVHYPEVSQDYILRGEGEALNAELLKTALIQSPERSDRLYEDRLRVAEKEIKKLWEEVKRLSSPIKETA